MAAPPAGGTELTDVASFGAGKEPSSASVSYVLAHETARALEQSGQYCRAAELLAVSLTEEAQRDNQRALLCMELGTDAERMRDVTNTMANQRSLARTLRLPLLDEREPALLGGCLGAFVSAHRHPPLCEHPHAPSVGTDTSLYANTPCQWPLSSI